HLAILRERRQVRKSRRQDDEPAKPRRLLADRSELNRSAPRGLTTNTPKTNEMSGKDQRVTDPLRPQQVIRPWQDQRSCTPEITIAIAGDITMGVRGEVATVAYGVGRSTFYARRERSAEMRVGRFLRSPPSSTNRSANRSATLQPREILERDTGF